MKNLKLKLLFASGFSLLVFNFVYAQSLNFYAPKSTQGDYFQVSLSINTENKPINTISGTIRVSSDKLRLTEVRYGNSIINLWVERPKLNVALGTITFAGGVPGGYNGSNGPILTFLAAARNSGIASVTLEDVSVLLNDGLGTILKEIKLGRLDLAVNVPPPSVKKTEPSAEKAEPEEIPVPSPEIQPDTVPPEDFIPVVTRHPNVENNKYFVSFFAVDKDSGIARYEVRERLWPFYYLTSKLDKPFTSAESPYFVKHQYWIYEIAVRAYDQSGNYKDASVLKPAHPFLIMAAIVLWTILVAGATYLYLRPQFQLRKKIKKI